MKFEKNSKYNTNALLALLVVAFAAAVVSLLLNISAVAAFVRTVLAVLAPVIYAFLLVLVLLPIVDFFENKFAVLLKKKKSYRKKAKVLAVLCTYVILLLVVALAVWILVSQISKAYTFIANFADEYFPILTDLINGISDSDGFIETQLSAVVKGLKDAANEWMKSVPDLAKTLAGTFGTVVSGVSNWVLAVIISIYALFRRTKLKALCKKANAALFSERANVRIADFLGDFYRNLAAFFSARAYNMIVLAVVFYLVLLVMGLEFYSMIALTVGICSFLPVVGLLVGGGIGAFVVLVTDTEKTVWFIIAFLVIAFLDYIFLRPRITQKRVQVSLGTTIVCIFIGYFVYNLLGALLALPLYVTVRDMFIKWNGKKKSDESGDAVSNKV